MRGVPGRRRALGHGARAARRRRRGCGHRGVSSGVSQLRGRLHGLAPQSQGDRRSRPQWARTARGRAALRQLPAHRRRRLPAHRSRAHAKRGGALLGARCRAARRLRRAAGCDRGRAARPGADDAAERGGRRLAHGVAGAGARRQSRRPPAAARHAAQARAARALRHVRRRLSRQLVRERSRSRPCTASTAWSATTQAPTPRARRTCCCTTCSAR